MSYKILHIGKYFPPVPGGIETFLRDLVVQQIKDGLNVKVLAHESPFNKGTNYDKIPIEFVKTYGKFLYAPLSPAFGLSIKRCLLSFQPHVIHVHLPNTSAFWLLLLKEVENIPLVIHWHADVVFSNINPYLRFAYFFYRPLELMLLKKAKAIIVTSKPYLDTSDTLKDFKEKCHIIPLGLDVERLEKISLEHSWAENVWGESQKRVLAVGRFAYYKGFQNLIKACYYIDNIRLVLVGDGEMRGEYEELIKKMDLNEKVYLTGHIDDTKLFSLYATTHIFCLPSLERTEAFGLSLLEALYFKKPFVVSKIVGSGMTWLVNETKAGITFVPENLSTLVMAINRFYENAEGISEVIINANKGLPKQFHIDAISDRIKEVYDSILS